MYFELRETDIDRHIQSGEARDLLALWRRRREEAGRIPPLSALWTSDLAPFEPYLMRLEQAGDDWRYAYAGKTLTTHGFIHGATEYVSQLPRDFRAFVERCHAALSARGAPIYAIHTINHRREEMLWERMMLPCVLPDGRAAAIVYLRPIEKIAEVMQSVFESTPNGIVRARWLRDEEGRVVDAVCLLANTLAATFLNRPIDDLVQGCLLELFPTFVESGIFRRLAALADTKETVAFEMTYEDGGATTWFSVSAMPQGDGFTLSLADITALKRANLELERARNELMVANAHLEQQATRLESAIADAHAAHAELASEMECRRMLEEELRRLALTDALTGLANRPALAARGDALASSGRLAALTVIAIDIDHFKAINDTHGHAGGDAVLVALADRMDDARLIGKAKAYRLGGEEFAVVLPNVSLDGAALVAERLRLAFAAEPIDANGTMVHVTSSFGVAQLAPGEDFGSLLERCDTALYRAKREGRNRVIVDEGEHAAAA